MDDYPRYALAAVASTATSTEWVTMVMRKVISRCGKPDELVSDNGHKFVSIWEDTLTEFGEPHL